MRNLFLMLIVVLGFTSCNAQHDKKDDTAMEQSRKKNESVNAPKGNWKVTREVDENGNIVKYDSVYSYSYSTHNGDTVDIKDVDSLIRSFRSFSMDRIPPEWNENFMRSLFFDDKMMQEDFFNDDFFQNRKDQTFTDMHERLKYMDSLHNLFFQDRFPQLKESKEQKRDSL